MVVVKGPMTVKQGSTIGESILPFFILLLAILVVMFALCVYYSLGQMPVTLQ